MPLIRASLRLRVFRYGVDRSNPVPFPLWTHSSCSVRLKSSSSDASSSSSSASSSQSLPALRKFKVTKIAEDGQMSTCSMQTSEILKDSAIYARDLFSLQLTSKQEYRHNQKRTARYGRTMSAILPRGKEIVLSFGAIRAVISKKDAWIFDAHAVAVKEFASDLQQHLQEQDSFATSISAEQKEPFELVFLEAVLRDTTDVFFRRIRLYEPIVDDFLDKVANEVFSDSGVHLLVPLKDSLQGFEMHVKQCLECLTGLLNNDEDMLALLITEQDSALQQGRKVEHSRHSDVELLLEEYGRQLNNILFEINYMLQRLQSKQDFVTLALSSYRNRMIRMNLYMSITGLSLGIGTASAGFFGMNLVNGLENHPMAFNAVIGGTCFVGVTVAASCFSFVSGKTMQSRAKQRLGEIHTLTSALSDMNALDVTIKKFLRNHTSMSRQEFRRKLRTSRTSRHVTDEEVELLFSALDVHKDGVLLHNDFESWQQANKEKTSKHPTKPQ